MYLLNEKNGEKVFRNFNGEETLVSGYQGQYQYLKVIKDKVTDNLNNGVEVRKPIKGYLQAVAHEYAHLVAKEVV